MKRKIRILVIAVMALGAMLIDKSSSGQDGAALDFDGGDDRVYITSVPALNALPVTIEAWAKPKKQTWESSDYYPSNLVSNDVIENYGLGMGININSDDQTWVTVAYRAGYRTFEAPYIVADVWTHIAVVYTTGNVKTYINGALKDDFSFTQQPLNGNLFMCIGNLNDDPRWGYRRFFYGSIDEVRVWSQALSEAQIQARYSCELTGLETCLGLAAYFKFNQGTAGGSNPTVTTLFNAIAGGNNGTLYSFDLSGNVSNWVAPGGVVTGNTCPNPCTTTVADNQSACFGSTSVSLTATVSPDPGGGTTLSIPAQTGATYCWTSSSGTSTAWETVGSAGFSAGVAYYQSLAFNGSAPYVAFRDGGNSNKTTVMKFEACVGNTNSLPVTAAGTYTVTVDINGCTASASQEVTVSASTEGGSVTGGGAVNAGINSTLLTLTNYVGSVQKWQYSTNENDWVDIAHTFDTYTAVNLTVNTWFRAVVKSGVCQAVNSLPAQITIFYNLQINGYAKYYNNPPPPRRAEDHVETGRFHTWHDEYRHKRVLPVYRTDQRHLRPGDHLCPPQRGVANQERGEQHRLPACEPACHRGCIASGRSAGSKGCSNVIQPATTNILVDDANAIRNAAKYGWFQTGKTTPWFEIPKWVFSGTTTATPVTGMVLNFGNISRDIYGLCAGDVNGSYIPPSGNKQAVPGMELINRGILPLTGEITFPVRVEDDMEIGAITLMLDFDPSLVEITGVEMPRQGDEAPYFIVTKDEGRGTRDEGRGTRDEGRRRCCISGGCR